MLVIITGASKGIGHELVKQLAAEKNVTVLAVSRSEKPLLKIQLESRYGNILPLKADIATAKGRTAVADAVRKTKLKLNVLVNNAGHLVNKPFAKIKEGELHAVYGTNVFAPFLLTQNLISFFEKNNAHVLNISSMGGFQGSAKFAGLSAYSSSKAALSGLTECLAEELKPNGISVNCLAIGAVQTEMLSKAFPGYKAPLSPAEMAGFIQYFALNGHRYFTGKILPVSITTP